MYRAAKWRQKHLDFIGQCASSEGLHTDNGVVGFFDRLMLTKFMP